MCTTILEGNYAIVLYSAYKYRVLFLILVVQSLQCLEMCRSLQLPKAFMLPWLAVVRHLCSECFISIYIALHVLIVYHVPMSIVRYAIKTARCLVVRLPKIYEIQMNGIR